MLVMLVSSNMLYVLQMRLEEERLNVYLGMNKCSLSTEQVQVNILVGSVSNRQMRKRRLLCGTLPLTALRSAVCHILAIYGISHASTASVCVFFG